MDTSPICRFGGALGELRTTISFQEAPIDWRDANIKEIKEVAKHLGDELATLTELVFPVSDILYLTPVQH